MTLRVAITRAAPEAEMTAERVRALGALPVMAPLLMIEPRAFETGLEHAQALMFTSSNGVRAFAAASNARTVRVLAVGDATAQAARAAGFTDVRSADGDVASLAALARASLDPRAGKLVHVAGAHVAGDLGAMLADAGFEVERRIAYDARAAGALPAAFAGPVDIVLFHSARAAETFIALGAPGASRLTAVCLSPAVAAAARKATWKSVIVAPAPREDALLGAIPTG